MSKRLRTGLRQALGLAGLVALWQWAAQAGHLNPLYMPAPSAVAATLVQLFVSGTIWPHLYATFSAALGGLVIGLGLGAVLGAAAALTPFIGDLLEPVMIGLNAVPRVVLAPLFVIWFGIGLGSKVALAVMLVAVLIFFTVFTG
ncbi:MAG: ABC transporter permease, partial [Stellaceae bacterium]